MNVSGPTPIVIMGCPTEDVIKYTISSSSYVRWREPFAIGQIDVVKNTETADKRLEVGAVFEVVYTFTDQNNGNNTATCVFNVTVLPCK